MIKLATVAFVLAALMGSYMATRHFQKKSIPWALPIIHGLLAGTGLALLGTALFSDAVSTVAWLAFGMFLLAAMGGVIVFRAYLRHQRLSSGMIIIHAMVAAMGLLFLIAFLYARGVVRESHWAQPLKVACGVSVDRHASAVESESQAAPVVWDPPSALPEGQKGLPRSTAAQGEMQAGWPSVNEKHQTHEQHEN